MNEKFNITKYINIGKYDGSVILLSKHLLAYCRVPKYAWTTSYR